METFKDAKQRIINELAEPFAKMAVKVFKKMGWTWAGSVESNWKDIYPTEEEIFKIICHILSIQPYPDKEIEKHGHYYCASGRINIFMFVWPKLKQWDIHLTLSP